jgi:hypothetical protein
MDSVPKNKRYAIKRLIDNDKTLIPSDLEKLKIVELLKMIEEQKIKSKQVIPLEHEFKPKSLLYYLGLDQDN